MFVSGNGGGGPDGVFDLIRSPRDKQKRERAIRDSYRLLAEAIALDPSNTRARQSIDTLRPIAARFGIQLPSL